MDVVVFDIDGCITSGKGCVTSSLLLAALSDEVLRKEKIYTLCTGRSAPYVEAIAQVIGIDQWCVCENGAYLYHPKTDEVIYNPLIKSEALAALLLLNQLFRQEQYRNVCKIELGKEVCISLNPLNISVEALFEMVAKESDPNLLYVNHSASAVDITPKGVDKGTGLKLLAQIVGFNLSDVLAVGDSSGDLPFMKLSGKTACPANASDAVKMIADYISPYPTTAGVVDILRHDCDNAIK